MEGEKGVRDETRGPVVGLANYYRFLEKMSEGMSHPQRLGVIVIGSLVTLAVGGGAIAIFMKFMASLPSK